MITGNSDGALVFRPEMMDPSASTGLWWCATAEDAQAVGTNAVCLSLLAKWSDLEPWKEWVEQFPYTAGRPSWAEAGGDCGGAAEPVFYSGYGPEAEGVPGLRHAERAVGQWAFQGDGQAADGSRRAAGAGSVEPCRCGYNETEKRQARGVRDPGAGQSHRGIQRGRSVGLDGETGRREKHIAGPDPAGCGESGAEGMCLFRRAPERGFQNGSAAAGGRISACEAPGRRCERKSVL